MFACECMLVCVMSVNHCVYMCRSDCNDSVYSKSPKTLKLLPNIHFSSEIDQNQINSSLRPLYKVMNIFLPLGDNNRTS